MTASCTLCGELFSIPDDLRGAKKTLGELGNIFGKHIVKVHSADAQSAFDPEHLKCSIAQLLQPKVSPMFGLTLQAAILYSYLKSEDEAFNDSVRQMKAMLEKAMEQKAVQPLVNV
jgi:hypothetical protein